ncbi:MAG: nicotinate-nucleotide adenylyltransferase, partial [Planctomycetota bacterium]
CGFRRVARRIFRPGHALGGEGLPEALAREWRTRLAASAGVLYEADHGLVYPAPTTLLDISASGIRRRLASGRSARYLLPAAVLDYIQDNSLYTGAG